MTPLKIDDTAISSFGEWEGVEKDNPVELYAKVSNESQSFYSALVRYTFL